MVLTACRGWKSRDRVLSVCDKNGRFLVENIVDVLTLSTNHYNRTLTVTHLDFKMDLRCKQGYGKWHDDVHRDG